MRATLKNTKTGELKEVKVGWSWTIFLYAAILGIPLFMRRLNVWGGFFVVLWVINFTCGSMSTDPDTPLFVAFILFPISFPLIIWLAIKGNEMTAKNYLEHGWVFADPDSDTTRYAKGKWGILV